MNVPKPHLPPGAQVGYPRWIVYDPAGSHLYAALCGKLDKARAKRIAQSIATSAGKPLGLVMEHHAGTQTNPTLVAHGLAHRAVWHLWRELPSGRGLALADLYFPTVTLARQIAMLIANAIRVPVLIAENRVEPHHFSMHRAAAGVYRPAPLHARNPKGRKAPSALYDALGNGIAVGSVLIGTGLSNAGRAYSVVTIHGKRVRLQEHLTGRDFWTFPTHYRVDLTQNPKRLGRGLAAGESVIYAGKAWWYEREGSHESLTGAEQMRYNEAANVVRAGRAGRYLVRSARDGKLAWADADRLERPLANPLPRGIDRRSIRTVGRGPKRVLIGCPKGQYMPRKRRCKVGTRAVNPSTLELQARGYFNQWQSSGPVERQRFVAELRHARSSFTGPDQAAVAWALRLIDAASRGGVARHNPAGFPVVGEIWHGISGDRCRILAVTGNKITVLQLDTGHRVTSTLRDFLLSYRPPRGAHHPIGNPKRRIRNAQGDAVPIFHGKYLLTDEGFKDYPNLGRVHSYIANGRRGAVYGCMVYPDGRWHWVNLARRISTVPFDLAQIEPSSYFKTGNPARSSGARKGRRLVRRELGSRKLRRSFMRDLAAGYAGGGNISARTKYYMRSRMARGQARAARLRANPKGRELSVPEKHQLKIARDTLKMNETMARVMGGPSHAEAREIILRLTGRPTPNPKGHNPRGPRIVYNRLLGGWYVVVGPHQTPLNGRFNSKAEAQAWLSGRRTNPGGFDAAAIQREMFGMTTAEVEAYLAPQVRLAGGWIGLATAMLSDTQELIARGQTEKARQLLNRVKWVLNEKVPRSNPRRKTAERQATALLRELDQLAHHGRTKAIRTAAKRQLARRGAAWSGAGVAARAMGRRANPKGRKGARGKTALVASLVAQLRANADDYHFSRIDHRTFNAAQLRVWNEIHRHGPAIHRAVLAKLRTTNPRRSRNPGGHISHRKALGMARQLVRHELESVRSGHGSNPRAPFQVGESVTVPYTGSSRRLTRERARIEGINPDGSLTVLVHHGRSAETHTFPAASVRHRPRQGALAAQGRIAATRARLEAKATRDRLRDEHEAIAAAQSEAECARAKYLTAPPDSGETRALRARITKLEREVEARQAVIRDLSGETAAALAAFNPRTEAPPHLLERAANAFRTWQDRGKIDVRRKRMKRPAPLGPVAAELGKLVGVVYRSDKYDGKTKDYGHDFSEPLPSLVTDPDARGLHIVGGNYKITADGIKH